LQDSSGLFALGVTGELTFAGQEWTGATVPTERQFRSCRSVLYWGNRRGDNVAVLRVIHETGAVVFTGHDAPLGNPSSIVFFDLAKAK
jgi:6-phosphogluconolactonase (cycloisomerase 2 family)